MLQVTDIFQKPMLPTSDLSSIVRGFQKFDEWMPEEVVVNLYLEKRIQVSLAALREYEVILIKRIYLARIEVV